MEAVEWSMHVVAVVVVEGERGGSRSGFVSSMGLGW